jgi:hypothetical protein
VDDDFGIAPRPEYVAKALQFLSQLKKVVDLAIKYDPGRLFLVCHGLMAACKIDDRQPTKAKTYRTIEMIALIVGTTMMHRTRHGL